MKAVILAAGRGKRCAPITDKAPKCLIRIGGRALIDHYLDSLQDFGVDDVVIVVGYLAEMIKEHLRERSSKLSIRFVENPDYERGNVLSVWFAREEVVGPLVLMDSDVYFEPLVLNRLLTSKNSDCLLMDTTSEALGEEMFLGAVNGRVQEVGRCLSRSYRQADDHEQMGEGVGFIRLSGQGAQAFISAVGGFIHSGNLDSEYEETFPGIFKKVAVGYELVDGLLWTEIDFPEDIEKARALHDQWELKRIGK